MDDDEALSVKAEFITVVKLLAAHGADFPVDGDEALCEAVKLDIAVGFFGGGEAVSKL